jgi:cell division protein FtsZ
VTVIATGLSPVKRQQAPISVVHTAPMLRTGTDNMPISGHSHHHMGHHAHQSHQPVGHQAPGGMAQDYSSMSTPTVWRNGRTAAAKVDALASNGMDEIEIPAFLRKQAD